MFELTYSISFSPIIQLKWIELEQLLCDDPMPLIVEIECGNSDAYTLCVWKCSLSQMMYAHTQTNVWIRAHSIVKNYRTETACTVWHLPLISKLVILTHTSTHRESERTIATTDGKWRLSNDKLVCVCVCVFFVISQPHSPILLTVFSFCSFNDRTGIIRYNVGSTGFELYWWGILFHLVAVAAVPVFIIFNFMLWMVQKRFE